MSASSKDFTQTDISAGLGDKDAQVDLGTIYKEGKRCTQGLPSFHGLVPQAVEQGGSEGQCRVGLLYTQGYSVSQDIAVAIDWCTKAANHGSVAAELDIGHLYY